MEDDRTIDSNESIEETTQEPTNSEISELTETVEKKESVETTTENLENTTQDGGKKNDKFFDLATVILISLIVFMVFVIGYRYIFITVKVSGQSMMPTLKNEDLYVVNKLAVPERNDIVVVELPERGEDYWIIKRTIAVEGDTVKLQGGNVYLKIAGENEFTCLEENYIQGKTFPFEGLHGDKIVKEGQEITLNKGEIFFLGDNREHSSDSRVYGVRTLENVVGVVTEWSRERAGFWYGFNKVVNFPSIWFSSMISTTGE